MVWSTVVNSPLERILRPRNHDWLHVLRMFAAAKFQPCCTQYSENCIALWAVRYVPPAMVGCCSKRSSANTPKDPTQIRLRSRDDRSGFNFSLSMRLTTGVLFAGHIQNGDMLPSLPSPKMERPGRLLFTAVK